MKYLYILLLLLTIALNPTSVSAYSCNEYSIDVPDSFEIDTETLSDFTSFYTDGLTVGIRIEYNSLKSDVTTYTEQQINALAKERLDALLIQAGEGVAITAKELTSFSNNNYPCLYIAYSGSTESYNNIYMETYLITTNKYKYTLVFSGDLYDDINIVKINQLKDSFCVNDDFIVHKAKVNTKNTWILISLLLIILVFIGLLVFYILVRYHQRSPQKRKRKQKFKKRK